jgi:hypothetical protein
MRVPLLESKQCLTRVSWERVIAKRGANYEMVMNYLETIGFKASADQYNAMGEAILKQIDADARGHHRELRPRHLSSPL